jgi:cell wall-associated NlpC family hydrolase
MVDTTLSNAYDSYRAALAMARVAKDQAADAQATQEKATKAMQSAFARAQTAAAKAQATAVAVAQRKTALVAELARLDGVSIALARKRQQALEAERRRKAEVAARKKAEEARKAAEAAHKRAEAERLRKAEEQRRRDEEQRQREQEQRDQDQRDQDQQNQPVPQSDPAPLPPGNIPSGGDPSDSQVEHAISYAEDQLGEPYVMGGAGPSVWDCSGLTMKAFGSVGIEMYHGARMQYRTSKPIGFGEIERGDLLFWSTAHGPPGTIHHVAIYLGNGMLINAPHTGDVVRIVSIGYMGIPDYFARPQNG